MEGVTILATDVVTMTNPVINTILIALCVALGLGFLFLMLGIATDYTKVGTIGLAILVIALVIFIISIPIDRMTQIPDYNTYEVILDDSVSMNEFMNIYEVLEQRGRIYVVKEIEE